MRDAVSEGPAQGLIRRVDTDETAVSQLLYLSKSSAASGTAGSRGTGVAVGTVGMKLTATQGGEPGAEDCANVLTKLRKTLITTVNIHTAGARGWGAGMWSALLAKQEQGSPWGGRGDGEVGGRGVGEVGGQDSAHFHLPHGDVHPFAKESWQWAWWFDWEWPL